MNSTCTPKSWKWDVFNGSDQSRNHTQLPTPSGQFLLTTKVSLLLSSGKSLAWFSESPVVQDTSIKWFLKFNHLSLSQLYRMQQWNLTENNYHNGSKFKSTFFLHSMFGTSCWKRNLNPFSYFSSLSSLSDSAPSNWGEKIPISTMMGAPRSPH